MMSVTGPAIGREAANDHIRLEVADHPNHISQDLVPIPDGKGLLLVFGEAEVVGTGEELFCSVNAAGSQ